MEESSLAPHLLLAFLQSLEGCTGAAGLWEWRQLIPFLDRLGIQRDWCHVASPASGLQMGAFRWGWEGRSMWEEGSKSHSDSTMFIPLVSQSPREAGGWFLDGKLDFSFNCFFQFFPGLCTFTAVWKGSTSVGA